MQCFLIESKLSQRARCLTFRALIYFIFIYLDCSIKIFPPKPQHVGRYVCRSEAEPVLDAVRLRKDRWTAPPILLMLNYFFNPNVKVMILPNSTSGFTGDAG